MLTSTLTIYTVLMLITFFSLEKGVELDHHWVEFDDVRYHIQVTFFMEIIVRKMYRLLPLIL